MDSPLCSPYDPNLSMKIKDADIIYCPQCNQGFSIAFLNNHRCVILENIPCIGCGTICTRRVRAYGKDKKKTCCFLCRKKQKQKYLSAYRPSKKNFVLKDGKIIKLTPLEQYSKVLKRRVHRTTN